MLDILIVEDNTDKARKVKDFINNLPLSKKCNVTIVTDFVGAKSSLKSGSFDVLILDLLIPRSFGDQPSCDNGRRLLTDLFNKAEKYKKPNTIIGLTSYNELIPENKTFFEQHLTFLFSFNDLTWEKIVGDRLIYLQATKSGNILEHHSGLKFDIAFVAALHSPELDNVRDLSLNWDHFQVENDPVNYYRATMQAGEKRLNLICAAPSEMGMSASATLTTKIKSIFNPRIIFMVGICAGVEGKVKIGDTIVADPAFDYNFGRIIESDEGEESLLADVRQLRIEERILNELRHFGEDEQFFTSLRSAYKGNKTDTIPNLLIGPIGSGSSVVANNKVIEKIVTNGHRKLLGIDMETYGVYYAAQKTLTPSGPVVSIKTVCDFANKEKHKDFQDFCAYLSANICLEYIRRYFSKW